MLNLYFCQPDNLRYTIEVEREGHKKAKPVCEGVRVKQEAY